jgi:hypothetical protein
MMRDRYYKNQPHLNVQVSFHKQQQLEKDHEIWNNIAWFGPFYWTKLLPKIISSRGILSAFLACCSGG